MPNKSREIARNNALLASTNNPPVRRKRPEVRARRLVSSHLGIGNK